MSKHVRHIGDDLVVIDIRTESEKAADVSILHLYVDSDGDIHRGCDWARTRKVRETYGVARIVAAGGLFVGSLDEMYQKAVRRALTEIRQNYPNVAAYFNMYSGYGI